MFFLHLIADGFLRSDDVRAIVSDSIQPIVGIIVENSPHCISNLLSTLWSALGEYDDLSAATSSVLQAVSLFYSFPKVCFRSPNFAL